MSPPLIELRDFSLAYSGQGDPQGSLATLRRINLTIGYEKFGLVGESGSGKSTLARALMGLLPDDTRFQARKLTFKGIDLTRLRKSAWRRLRKRHMGMIFQEPLLALNPMMTIGRQLSEVASGWPHTRRRASLKILESVHIQASKRVYDSYPHHLSGGMRQRVMIAMMVMTRPDLLIADEAVSALDAPLKLEILALLDETLQQRPMGLIFISHDLDLVRSFCDRVAIMRNGEIVECLPTSALGKARHPYTRALLDCVPRPGDKGRQRPLPVPKIPKAGL